MTVSASTPLYASLRERIAAIGSDGRMRALESGMDDRRVALGHALADHVLGGGLKRGALHEMRHDEPGDAPAATGFALACVARLGDGGSRPWMWVRQDLAGRETGEPYGPGLAALGLDPSRLVILAAADARDVLRAAEEGVRCAALAAVLVEPWGDPRALDLTALRRLALAAEESGVPVLLLRNGAHGGPAGAVTRWRIAAAPSLPLASLGRLPGLGHPAFAATLERNRQQGGLGEGGSWIMEWSPDEHAFAPPRPGYGSAHAAALPAAGPGPAVPADGPAAPERRPATGQGNTAPVRRTG
jgi:protein ImuA